MHSKESDSLVGAYPPSFKARWASKPTPGPGQYDPQIKGRSGKWHCAEDSGAEFIFKSRTLRSILGAGGSIPGKDAPPPGTYDIVRAETVMIKSGTGAQAAFKATPRKPLLLDHPAPGPGTYQVMTNEASFKRIPLRGKVGTIAVPPPRPATPLSNQTAVPGSGATPIAFPGPGHYSIAKCADSVHRSAPISTSNFVSRSLRFENDRTKALPGPGFYHPIPDIRFRSFHLNIDQQWSA